MPLWLVIFVLVGIMDQYWIAVLKFFFPPRPKTPPKRMGDYTTFSIMLPGFYPKLASDIIEPGKQQVKGLVTLGYFAFLLPLAVIIGILIFMRYGD